MAELLVRGGTLVDGTGGALRRGDVRAQNRRIVEIGLNLRSSPGSQLGGAGGP